MQICKQIFYILLFSLLGEALSIIIAPMMLIPGSVIGMLLLFLALHFKWIKMEEVDEVGTWLTNNMALFFVPAGVGLITNFHILGGVWWKLIIIMLASVFILLISMGHIVQILIVRNEKKKNMNIKIANNECCDDRIDGKEAKYD